MDTNLSGVQDITMTLAYVMLIFFIISIICAGVMIFSLAKKGDERKKYILSRSCTQTLLVYISLLFIDVLYTILFESNGGFYIENASVLSLGVLSIIFTISLFFNKMKHGD